MHTGIHIGNTRTKDEYKGIAKALLKIMGARADEETKRAAIQALTELGEVKNVSVSGASIVGDAHFSQPYKETSTAEAFESAVRRAAGVDPDGYECAEDDEE